MNKTFLTLPLLSLSLSSYAAAKSRKTDAATTAVDQKREVAASSKNGEPRLES